MKVGVAYLPLHYGKVPRWLFRQMVKLSKSIATILVSEYGEKELLQRLADPFWFQCFGCVLGYDWHSSGVTTTSLGALKQALKDLGVKVLVAGGKGKTSRKTPQELEKIGEEFSFSTKKIEELKKASRLVAKVDNAVLQDNYQLYHHCFIISSKGEWAVVQQGMCPVTKTARRYHWLSLHLKSFVNEPHEGIITDLRREKVIDLSAGKSEETRKCSLDLVQEKPRKILSYLNSLRLDYNNSLLRFFKNLKPQQVKVEKEILRMPKNLNWKALEQAFELKPKNYEELVALQGLGPASIRALALISHLIFGTKLSWKDPPKYSFAHGGKDGIPYPVSKKLYSKTLEVLEDAVKNAELGKNEKLDALKRLKDFLKFS